MLYAGVDIGSLWTKAVIVLCGRMHGYGITPTGADNDGAATAALEQALNACASPLRDPLTMAATGAGREDLRAAAHLVNEMLCAARGARALCPDAGAVIDLGAENTRVMRLDGAGGIVDYALNDRCASGTGVFLEAMSRVMNVPVEEMGPLSLTAAAGTNMTSTCVVFAESEVVSQVHRRIPREEILKGIHRSIASRISSLVNRVCPGEPLVAVGGLAKNSGIIAALAELTGSTLTVPDRPDLVPALGAALLAADRGGARC